MSNANLKSKDEAARRMRDGELFTDVHGTSIYYYDANAVFLGESPFEARFAADNVRIGPITPSMWDEIKQWKLYEPSWIAGLNPQSPTICWLWTAKNRNNPMSTVGAVYQMTDKGFLAVGFPQPFEMAEPVYNDDPRLLKRA